VFVWCFFSVGTGFVWGSVRNFQEGIEAGLVVCRNDHWLGGQCQRRALPWMATFSPSRCTVRTGGSSAIVTWPSPRGVHHPLPPLARPGSLLASPVYERGRWAVMLVSSCQSTHWHVVPCRVIHHGIGSGLGVLQGGVCWPIVHAWTVQLHSAVGIVCGLLLPS
jgi:hypothetical protein